MLHSSNPRLQIVPPNFIAADFVLLDDAKAEAKVFSEAEKSSQVSRVEEARLTRRIAQRRIQLRLNPTKDSHKQLYRAVTALIPATGDDHRKIRVRLVRLAQKFLRQEWLRVKAEAGEWHTTNTSGPRAGV